MSSSYLEAAAARTVDADGGSNPRQKIAVLSEKVIDTNPYSRLMCALCRSELPWPWEAKVGVKSPSMQAAN